MKVRATERGFLNNLREPGEVFEIEPDQFSKVWMEKVEGVKPKAKPAEEASTSEDLA